jgi:hypothetical protein
MLRLRANLDRTRYLAEGQLRAGHEHRLLAEKAQPKRHLPSAVEGDSFPILFQGPFG